MRTVFTLLALVGFAVSNAFAQPEVRLRFTAYNGDPQKPEKMDFQINAIGGRSSTHFLKLGEMVPQTKLKLEGFVYKTRRNNAAEEDVSELTLRNIETKKTTVLPLGAKIGSDPVL